MRLAILLDPLEHIKVYKDTTFAIMREAARRGHALFVLEQGDLWLEGTEVWARVRRLDLIDDARSWYSLGEPKIHVLGDFDWVLMRKDPPFDLEYVYTTYLLELAERQGARIFNRPAAIRDYNEKLAIARFPQFVAPTLVSREMARLRAFIEAQGDAVIKPLNAMGGAGVFRVSPADPNLSVILETMTQLGTRTVMAQRYIPEIRAGDKRILLIDGEPVPWALARIPKAGETRGNLAAGGRGVAQPLSDRDWEIATTLGPVLKSEGLFLVGLDVIGDWLTEINVTSPTGMQEITAQTGFEVAAKFMDALERQ
ncbi:glutathione synthase [Thiobacter aerophilum]|uniref:Glutathione synthetase n=1 Tax=Thiobacter aerophilum TaxID=3121275 RepID=A0ABV0EDD7_9BURK